MRIVVGGGGNEERGRPVRCSRHAMQCQDKVLANGNDRQVEVDDQRRRRVSAKLRCEEMSMQAEESRRGLPNGLE